MAWAFVVLLVVIIILNFVVGCAMANIALINSFGGQPEDPTIVTFAIVADILVICVVGFFLLRNPSKH